MDLSEFRTTIRTLIQDTQSQFFNDDEVDSGLRMALADYSTANPCAGSRVLPLADGDGNLSLTDLPGDACVTRLYYPWDSTRTIHQQERNRVLFWEMTPTCGSAALHMETGGTSLPLTGENVRVHYTLAHTIRDLDGAAQTSIPTAHAGILCRGAAGYTLQSGTTDRAELLDRSVLERLAAAYLLSFRLLLEEVLKCVQQAGSAVIQWPGMDKFDFIQ